MNDKNQGFSLAKLTGISHSVATILNGAIKGGLYGAAIAAAEFFLPQLLKIAGCLFLLVVLLPFFLFLSLVNPNFRFPSVEDDAVKAMNRQAAFVCGLYENFDHYTRLEADDIISNLSAGYDDVVVTEDLGNTNRSWLTAISSAHHDQDLFKISESSIREIIRQNLAYSYWVEVYYASGDEDEEDPLYRIHISLWDIGPQALMNKLGFDPFHTRWAGFLHDNLAESQSVDPSSPDYTGDLPGMAIGDLSFAEGGREVVYWNQMDWRWCNEPYGKTQTIGYAGCGPTALAMVVSTLTDRTMDPKEMADWAYENGYCCEGDGSYRTLIPEGAAHFGLSVSCPGRDGFQEVVDALAEGKLVVAIMGPGHFTTSGHFIVLWGVTTEGKLLVADPVSLTKSQQEWDAEIVFSEASSLDAAGGPFWVIG